MKKIRKAVFPVAGLGTRFLPATKASPKEMLSIVDKPLIQYAVEEAIEAGITEIIFVTGRNKRSIEDHFDKAYELEAELKAKNKLELLEMVQTIKPSNVDCFYVRQPEALGLGHAILCAKRLVKDEPFAVFLADDLIVGKTPIMQQMVQVYEQYNSSVIGIEKIEKHQTTSYGIIDGNQITSNLYELHNIVEKPKPENAPSNMGVVGRYILTPEIFSYLENIEAGAGGEIQLTDGIAQLLTNQKVLAYNFDGIRYDCGSKIGFLKATVDLALQHDECKDEFYQFLKTKQN